MEADNDGLVEPIPAWTMLEFTFSIHDTDATMVARCNGRQVVVRLAAENFSESPSLKEKYLFYLKVADVFELGDHTVEDFYDWIAEPLLPAFRQLGALESMPNTLEALLYPETIYFNLRAEGESVVAVPQQEAPQSSLFGIPVDDEICSSWPSFRPSEVQPAQESNHPGLPSSIPSKVTLNDGTIAFLKIMRHGDNGFLLSELGTYGKIRDAGLSSSLRISRLLGLVRAEDGLVFGLLLTYIDCQRKTLFCAAQAGTDISVRRKWAQQIDYIVAELHHNGIAWGDAKPDNVLIDQNNDAWLIDFGGSYTEGWVPKELAGTVEGDLVGLEKMKTFLDNIVPLEGGDESST